MSTELHRIVHEIIIDARGSVAGAAQSVRANKEVEQSTNRLADAEERARIAREKGVNSYIGPIQSTARLRTEYQKLQASLDPLMAAEARHRRAMERAILTTDAAVRRGVATEVDAAATIKRLREQQIIDLKRVREEMDRLASAQAGSMVAANDNAAAWRRRNTMYQMVDVAQGIPLLFQSPTHGLLNIGNQAAQIGQNYAGVGGAKAALADILSMLGPIARGFGPIAAAAGAVGISLLAVKADMEATTDTALTLGDVLLGGMDAAVAGVKALGGAVMNFIQPAIDWLSPAFEQTWRNIQAATAAFINWNVRGFLVSFETIRQGVTALPSAFIVAGQAAANGFVGAIEWLVKKSIGGIQTVISNINGFIDRFGGNQLRELLGWEISLPDLPNPDEFKLGRFTFAADSIEDLEKRAATYGMTMARIANEDYAGQAMEAWTGATGERARLRLAELEKATDGVGRAARDAHDPWRGLRDEMNATARAAELMDNLLFEREQIFRSPVEQKVAASFRRTGLRINRNYCRQITERILAEQGE